MGLFLNISLFTRHTDLWSVGSCSECTNQCLVRIFFIEPNGPQRNLRVIFSLQHMLTLIYYSLVFNSFPLLRVVMDYEIEHTTVCAFLRIRSHPDLRSKTLLQRDPSCIVYATWSHVHDSLGADHHRIRSSVVNWQAGEFRYLLTVCLARGGLFLNILVSAGFVWMAVVLGSNPATAFALGKFSTYARIDGWAGAVRTIPYVASRKGETASARGKG